LAKFSFVVKPLQIRESEQLVIVLRPFARSNLPDLLSARFVTNEERLAMAEQFVFILKRCHSVKVYHGDLTPNKVLCGTFGQLFISDFTTIKPFCPDSTVNVFEFYSSWFGSTLGCDVDSGSFGRGCYLAPERLQLSSEENWQAADLFSLGCILAELLSSDLSAFLSLQDLICLSTVDGEEKFHDILVERMQMTQVHEEHRTVILDLCQRDPLKRVMPSWNHQFSKLDYFSMDRYERIEQLPAFSRQLLSSNKFSLLFGSFLSETDFSVKCHLFDLFLREVVADEWPSGQVSELKGQLLDMFESLEDGDCFKEIMTATLKASWNDKVFCDSFLRSLPTVKDLKSLITDSRKIPTKIAFELMYKTVQLYKSRRVVDPEFELLTADYFLALMQREDFNTESLVTQSIEFVEDFVAPLCEIGRLPATIIDEYIRINDKEASKLKPVTLMPIDKRKFDFLLDLEKYQVPLEGALVSNFTDAKVHQALRQKKMAEIELKNSVRGSLMLSGSIFATWTESSIQFWNLEVVSTGPFFDYEFDYEIIDACANGNRLWIMNAAQRLVELEPCDLWAKVTRMKVVREILIQQEQPRLLLVHDSILVYSLTSCEISLIKPIESIHLELESFVLKMCVLDRFSVMACMSNGTLHVIDISMDSMMNTLYSWSLDDSSFTPIGVDTCTDSSQTLIALVTAKSEALYIWLYNFKYGHEAILEPIFRIAMIDQESEDDKVGPLGLVKGANSRHDARNPPSFDIKLILRKGEVIFLGNDGILRLFDFVNMNTANRSSILLPDYYKPSLKLRNKQGLIAEIVEKRALHNFPAVNYGNIFLAEGPEPGLVYIAERKIIAIS